MKKEIILFLCLIMVFPLISAIELNMGSEFSKGETAIASFQGNFLDSITKDNIHFYRGYTETFFSYDVAKIGDSYYIYFQSAGKTPANYSINLTNIRYMVGQQVSTQQISKKFEIKDNLADFSVNPGFVISDENFSIKLQNFQDKDIDIKLDTEIIFGDDKENFVFLLDGDEIIDSIILHSGQTNSLRIALNNITQTTIRTISLSTDNLEYNIPVYIIAENLPGNFSQDNESENQTNITDNETEIECSWFTKLFGCIEEGDKTNQTGNKTSANESQNVTKNEINKTTSFWDIFKKKNVTSEGGSITKENLLSKTCAEINGKVCPQGQICANTTLQTKDANCCISNCVTQKENPNKKIIGWIIIIFVIIIVLFFFIKKFRKVKNKEDVLLGNK